MTRPGAPSGTQRSLFAFIVGISALVSAVYMVLLPEGLPVAGRPWAPLGFAATAALLLVSTATPRQTRLAVVARVFATAVFAVFIVTTSLPLGIWTSVVLARRA